MSTLLDQPNDVVESRLGIFRDGKSIGPARNYDLCINPCAPLKLNDKLALAVAKLDFRPSLMSPQWQVNSLVREPNVA